MTLDFHIRHSFPDRHFSVFGDQMIFDDGLPPPTLEELALTHEQAHATWLQEQKAASAKTWPTKTEFWAEFEIAQKAAIRASSNVTVQLLLEELRMWDYTIRADDPRIVAGIAALAGEGIISQEAADGILGLH